MILFFVYLCNIIIYLNIYRFVSQQRYAYL